jgi:hypothetical protein
MTMDQKIKIGSRIVFKAVTRWGAAKASRLVTGFTRDGEPTVRYNSWGDFIVHWHEIVEVESYD